MQNDRKTGQTVGNFLQNIKTKLRLLAWFEFVSAVAGTDGNRKGIHARTGDKILHFVRIGKLRLVVRNVYVVLHTGELAQFGFNGNIVFMRVFHNAAGFLHIFLVGLGGTVIHNGSKTAVDTILADFK
ncbi:hypothetical protein CAGA_25280 [Caproiciproducens galactitolivorans]|uniref:Uncharacterized protein n=1 Tax=Caproiciproducens galactitolivorans TaxID=642589 RepID=A0A4Z0Y6V4_9FIRM|nr:hypothetical protein CAGA_25280 [Caproiciproducens galactitolivorans]